MLKKTIEKYSSYKVLAEDASTLEFNIVINNITKEIEKYKIYEVDHTEKVIYLELLESIPKILIASNDELELPLCVVKNLSQAAEFMGIEATHLYRAWRHAGRPSRLNYKKFLLIFF